MIHTLETLDLNISCKRCYSELHLADLYVITEHFKYFISQNVTHLGILCVYVLMWVF